MGLRGLNPPQAGLNAPLDSRMSSSGVALEAQHYFAVEVLREVLVERYPPGLDSAGESARRGQLWKTGAAQEALPVPLKPRCRRRSGHAIPCPSPSGFGLSSFVFSLQIAADQLAPVSRNE